MSNVSEKFARAGEAIASMKQHAIQADSELNQSFVKSTAYLKNELPKIVLQLGTNIVQAGAGTETLITDRVLPDITAKNTEFTGNLNKHVEATVVNIQKLEGDIKDTTEKVLQDLTKSHQEALHKIDEGSKGFFNLAKSFEIFDKAEEQGERLEGLVDKLIDMETSIQNTITHLESAKSSVEV